MDIYIKYTNLDKYVAVSGFLSKGLLSKVGTLLLSVKSLWLFKTLFFPLCSRLQGLFGHIRFVLVLFILLLGRLTLQSRKLTLQSRKLTLGSRKKSFFFLVVRPLRRGGGVKGPAPKEKGPFFKLFFYL